MVTNCAHCKRQIQFIARQKQWIHSGYGASAYCNYNSMKRAEPGGK